MVQTCVPQWVCPGISPDTCYAAGLDQGGAEPVNWAQQQQRLQLKQVRQYRVHWQHVSSGFMGGLWLCQVGFFCVACVWCRPVYHSGFVPGISPASCYTMLGGLPVSTSSAFSLSKAFC